MPILFGMVLLVFGTACYGDTDSFDVDATKAYLIIEATNSDETARQPRWIALMRAPKKLIHLPASQTLLAVNPGKFSIKHLDMREDIRYRGDSIFLRSNSFELEPGIIYLMGKLVVTKKYAGKYELETIGKAELLVKACRIAPLLFKVFPVSNFDQVVPVDCAEFDLQD